MLPRRFFALPVVVTAQSKTIPVSKVAYKDAKTKKYHATVTLATFRGNTPVVKLANDDSKAAIAGLINDYIKEDGAIEQASLELEPIVTLSPPRCRKRVLRPHD